MNLPQGFVTRPQFIVWRLEYKPGTLKPTKIPYDAKTGQRASTTDATTWSDYATAIAAWQSGGYAGIGWVFTATDDYFFFDLDGCRDAVTGEVSAEAQAICANFNGAAWEVSQSGEGLHLFGRCDKVLLASYRNRWAGWLEFYRAERFVAFGPGGIAGNLELDWTATLAWLVPVRATGETGEDMGGSSVDPRWRGPTDDDELIKKFLANTGGTKAKLGSSPTNRQLWEGDAAALGQFFPSTTGKAFDQSQADLSLMNALAFWTGRDHERMVRLFTRSALGKRDKWTKRAYYRNKTTWNSIGHCRDVYNVPTRDERRAKQIAENVAIGDEFNIKAYDLAAPELTVTEMFDRLIYVHGVDGVVDIATFQTYKTPVCERVFARSIDVVNVGEPDPITGNYKQVRVSRFKTWIGETDGRAKNQVEALTWKPKAGLICDVPESHARGFNMWRGFQVPSLIPNDPEWLAAWHTHLAYLVPIAEERQRFELWLAHIFQRPDVLPHTGYLMFTEQTGIGRNWLSSVLVRVMRGYVAAGVDIKEVLDGSFNGRLTQKLLAVVDEAKAGMQDSKRFERSETLKTIINQSSRKINVKHGLETIEHNCMRWLFFSNHPDALPFENNDRRIIVIANPTVRASVEYYTWLYGMLEYPAFIGAVYQHLMSLDISSFNPGEHAPMNDAKLRALGEMQSEVDKVVSDFVAKWPGQLATSSQVKAYVQELLGEDGGKRLNGFQHILKRGGIISPNKVVKINGKSERVVIIRDLTPEQINQASPQWIEAQILDASSKFIFR
jgi:primase-polymerase (primpol)-like protein